MEASNATFIVAAYSITWIVILGYLARLLRKAAHASAEYQRIVADGDVSR